MIFRLKAPSPKIFLNAGLHNSPFAIQQSPSVYIKPFLVAMVITVLLSFLIGVALITLTGWLPSAAKAPGMELNVPPTKNTTQLLQDSIEHQHKLEALIYSVKEKCPAVGKIPEASVTVRLSDNLIYRLHCSSSLQEAATPDERLLLQLTRHLDAQGIEYAVHKNAGEEVLLCKNEWIVSWGGILYLPPAGATSVLTTPVS